MLHDHYGAELRAARWISSVLVYASAGLASAIGGAAVALQLAAAPPTGEYFPRPRGAATMAAMRFLVVANTGDASESRRRTRPRFAAFEQPKLFVEEMRHAFKSRRG